MSAVPTIASVPPLDWLGVPGDATYDDAGLTMTGGGRTDWFNDPVGPQRLASTPVLGFALTGNAQLSARVQVGFRSLFDAGVLFVHQGPDDYAKLCFEYSPAGDPTVVSVVTRGPSDDANGPVVPGDSVHLRVSRLGDAYAFHYALDGENWELVRLFQLRNPSAPTTLGFCSQSPTGDGCTTVFSDIHYRQTTLVDPRDGS